MAIYAAPTYIVLQHGCTKLLMCQRAQQQHANHKYTHHMQVLEYTLEAVLSDTPANQLPVWSVWTAAQLYKYFV